MSLRTVLIIDDRKLKQMTKDLVMHPSYEELIVLLKSEKNKIIRMNSSFH